MASTPANGPSAPTPDPDESSLALPPGGGLLARLPGLDSPDAITLVGRNRLSQALELESTPDNRYLRLSLYVLGAAALIFFPWAALTPITQVVHASGEVVPEGDVNVIQHLEGGIVARVDVKDGEEVKPGQVMLELRPNLVESEYRATQQQLKNLELQQQQLQAAIRGDASLNPAAVGLTAENKVTQAQQGLLDSRLANRKDQVTSAAAMVGQKTAEVAGLNRQIALNYRQRNMWAGLVESGAASKLNLLSIDTKLAELIGARNEALKALAQAQSNLRAVQSGLQLEQTSKIAEAVNEQAVVEENIKKVRNQLERTKITSPVAGVVSDLRFKAPGAVVGPGAVVLMVVPSGTQKTVEARVPSGDIGFVKVGQKVDVKLQPFDSSIYGSVPGTVVSIAGSSKQDPDDRKYYYDVSIRLDRQYVGNSTHQYPIQVGMPLVADIKGQQRSVLRYLFQPFTRTLDSALRETR
ncbi:MAG: HlyD family type I secretion periplasmic adaptor subunit [Synechococcus sp. ELA057]